MVKDTVNVNIHKEKVREIPPIVKKVGTVIGNIVNFVPKPIRPNQIGIVNIFNAKTDSPKAIIITIRNGIDSSLVDI